MKNKSKDINVCKSQSLARKYLNATQEISDTHLLNAEMPK